MSNRRRTRGVREIARSDLRSSGPSSSLSDVLATRGLTLVEIRTYEALVDAGIAAPAVLARTTGQSRARAYEVLRHLVKRGLAYEEPTRPVRFRAVPLPDVLSRTLAELSSHQKIIQDLQHELPAGPIIVAGTSKVGIKNLSVATGRKGVLAEIRRMVRSARRILYIGGGGQLGNRLALSLDLVQELRQARRRNVDVRLHFLRSATLSGSLDALEGAVGAQAIRWVDPEKAVPIGYAVSEDVAMVIIVQPDDGAPLRGDDLGIRFESIDMVETISRRLVMSEEARTVAEPMHRPATMEKGTLERQFLSAVQRARKEILCTGPPGWTRLMLLSPPGSETLFSQARERGVRLRALVAADSLDLTALQPLVDTWEIRVVGWVPGAIALVDDADLFHAYPSTDRPDARHLQHSGEPGAVHAYIETFERLWAGAAALHGRNGVQRTAHK